MTIIPTGGISRIGANESAQSLLPVNVAFPYVRGISKVLKGIDGGEFQPPSIIPLRKTTRPLEFQESGTRASPCASNLSLLGLKCRETGHAPENLWGGSAYFYYYKQQFNLHLLSVLSFRICMVKNFLGYVNYINYSSRSPDLPSKVLCI